MIEASEEWRKKEINLIKKQEEKNRKTHAWLFFVSLRFFYLTSFTLERV